MGERNFKRNYIRNLLERALIDPETVRKELEAKETLSQAEFAILDTIRKGKNVRFCRHCGQIFKPKYLTQKYCFKSCRIKFHIYRYYRMNRLLRKKRHLWKIAHDEEYRNKWMSRINELRLKSGRLPYWNTSENRPYTKSELEWMKRTGYVLTGNGGKMLWEKYVEHLRIKSPSKEPNWKVTVFLPKRTEEPEPETKPEPQKHFVFVHHQVLGTEATSKVEIKPDRNCKHSNVLPVTSSNGKEALLCRDCGAIRFHDEGIGSKWRYFANDVEVWL